jgi:hypothetical protein
MRDTWGTGVNYSEEENDPERELKKQKVRRVFRRERSLCDLNGNRAKWDDQEGSSEASASMAVVLKLVEAIRGEA